MTPSPAAPVPAASATGPVSGPVEPLVVATDVSKTFGGGARAVVAVHGVNIAIAPTARIAVTGPSGSGKSTLVHLLAGLERPTTGRVTWPAMSGAAGRPAADIGLVFQGPSLVPALDVAENVGLPLVIAGVPDDEAAHRAHRALRDLDIASLARKLPEEISGGQAQRVAVARVLAARPRLILADEPTGQLDHEAAAHVVDVLLEAVDRLDAALAVATHDLAVAARLSTHWTMHDGSVTGTVRERHVGPRP